MTSEALAMSTLGVSRADEPEALDGTEDPEEPVEPASVPTGILVCAECTILIGPTYLETEPYPHPHGAGVVCFRCLESLERRAARGPAPEPLRGWGDRRFR